MIKSNLLKIKDELPANVTLIVVTKFRSIQEITSVYNEGYRNFGENRVQDLVDKYNELPKDINWHLIGHLQSNKVKYIAQFVYLIHSLDSFELAQEINKQAIKNDKTIKVLLQFHVASETSKFGIDPTDYTALVKQIISLSHIEVCGIMGMATNTSDQSQVSSEFKRLNSIFKDLKDSLFKAADSFNILSMGMSNDYKIAIKEGSNMIRVGSLIFENPS